MAPASILDALRLCKDFARERKNLSVERIAALMGVTVDALYKWLATGRMPLNLIPAYEHVCGAHYVTRYLSSSSGFLAIQMPSGRSVTATEINQLQALLNTAVGSLIAFTQGQADVAVTLSEIESAMNALAWHHVNVSKAKQPELELGEGNDCD